MTPADAVQAFHDALESEQVAEEQRRRDLVTSLHELLREVWESRRNQCDERDEDNTLLLLALTTTELFVPRHRSGAHRAVIDRLRGALQLPITLTRRLCVELIHSSGHPTSKLDGAHPLWVSRVIKGLGHLDEAFVNLNEEVVRKLLSNYRRSPRGSRGAIGAEGILAELIYEVDGALGIRIKPNEDQETAVERIRRQLFKGAPKAKRSKLPRRKATR